MTLRSPGPGALGRRSAPVAGRRPPVLGRPSAPVECYLRLMFLKFRYRLGYESLCAEVSAKAAALAAALAAAGLRDPAAGRRRGRLRRAGQ